MKAEKVAAYQAKKLKSKLNTHQVVKYMKLGDKSCIDMKYLVVPCILFTWLRQILEIGFYLEFNNTCNVWNSYSAWKLTAFPPD